MDKCGICLNSADVSIHLDIDTNGCFVFYGQYLFVFFSEIVIKITLDVEILRSKRSTVL